MYISDIENLVKKYFESYLELGQVNTQIYPRLVHKTREKKREKFLKLFESIPFLWYF